MASACAGARRRVRDADQVDADLHAVVPPGLDRVLERAVGRDAEDHHVRGARLRGDLDLHPSGVHRLHVGDDRDARERGPELADGLETLALDERRADLDQVDAALDRLARDAEGLRDVVFVERELEQRFRGGYRVMYQVRSEAGLRDAQERGRSRRTDTDRVQRPRD